jgi:erythronate-4-phosphate dehydrogenase
MKIVADEHISLIENYFGGLGDLILKPGRAITAMDLFDADILLVRSVTQVNRELLANSQVKFVGSATSGADHLDINWLDANHIKWSVAEGCNAEAVAEYVVCVVAALQNMHFLQDKKIRAAVIGVGRIGKRVADFFKLLGFEVVLCDPLRKDISSTSFSELTDLDLISFHTPLTKTGAYPTYHLVQKEFLQKQKKNCILLNAGRGEVFSFADLKKYGRESLWCLDVWEKEPDVDFEVLHKALIATPHIAGYSLQSKYRGIAMVYQAALQQGVLEQKVVNEPSYPTRDISAASAKNWRDAVLTIFNPVALTIETKERLMMGKGEFDTLRKKFADRYEFGFVKLIDVDLPEKDRSILQAFKIRCF